MINEFLTKIANKVKGSKRMTRWAVKFFIKMGIKKLLGYMRKEMHSAPERSQLRADYKEIAEAIIVLCRLLSAKLDIKIDLKKLNPMRKR